MINSRQSFRLRKQFAVRWSIPEQNIEGEGTIYNISLSGMLFTTDKLFAPDHGLTMHFKLAGVPAFPARGELAWFIKTAQASRYKCGVRFFSMAAQSSEWKQWMEKNVLELADAQDNKILDQFLHGDRQDE